MTARDRITDFHRDMIAWRRDIHAHPELGFQETRTADLVAAKLEAFGIEVHRGLGKTGVVGTLRVGKSSRTLGLRADMDALPIQESNTFEHRSTHAGVMHACGHDGHTAMLLGAAKLLSERRDELAGEVRFMFQPAEEKPPGGARQLVAAGVMDGVDLVVGAHLASQEPVARIGVSPGAVTAAGTCSRQSCTATEATRRSPTGPSIRSWSRRRWSRTSSISSRGPSIRSGGRSSP